MNRVPRTSCVSREDENGTVLRYDRIEELAAAPLPIMH
jgi:hypothetical protein